MNKYQTPYNYHTITMVALLALSYQQILVKAFQCNINHNTSIKRNIKYNAKRTTTLAALNSNDEVTFRIPTSITRRNVFKSIQTITTSSLLFNNIANAEETTLDKMTTYNDPNGLFNIRIPKGYFIFRRPGGSSKDKTKNRKGSSIFTSGDIGKAEIISVDRFTTISFLEEEGGVRIVDKTLEDLSTFDKIGTAETIAKYIILRRNREQQQSNTNIIPKPTNIVVSPKVLSFEYSTKINVQKPELLMEQMGVDELFRITLVRIDLSSNDGYMNVCYASALQTEFYGEDGVLLREAIDSFQVLEQKV